MGSAYTPALCALTRTNGAHPRMLRVASARPHTAGARLRTVPHGPVQSRTPPHRPPCAQHRMGQRASPAHIEMSLRTKSAWITKTYAKLTKTYGKRTETVRKTYGNPQFSDAEPPVQPGGPPGQKHPGPAPGKHPSSIAHKLIGRVTHPRRIVRPDSDGAVHRLGKEC